MERSQESVEPRRTAWWLWPAGTAGAVALCGAIAAAVSTSNAARTQFSKPLRELTYGSTPPTDLAFPGARLAYDVRLSEELLDPTRNANVRVVSYSAQFVSTFTNALLADAHGIRVVDAASIEPITIELAVAPETGFGDARAHVLEVRPLHGDWSKVRQDHTRDDLQVEHYEPPQ